MVRRSATNCRPGSVVEFQKVIGPLVDPAAHGGDARDAFHVLGPPEGYLPLAQMVVYLATAPTLFG